MPLPLNEARTLTDTPQEHLDDHLLIADVVNALQLGRPKTATPVTMYTVPGVPIMNVATRLLGGSRLHYSPFFVANDITVDRIGTEVSSAAAAGNTVRLGIYKANTDWQPGALVVDAGTVATDSTGYKELTINETLTPGIYLFAVHTSTAGATHRAYRGAVPGGGIDVGQSAGNALIVQVWVNTAIAALPDPGTAYTVLNGANLGWEYYTYMRISTP